MVPGGSDSKESACNAGDQVQPLGWESPLEKGITTHSNMIAWRISWTEVPGGWQSMGLQRVRHNWVTNTILKFNAEYSVINVKYMRRRKKSLHNQDSVILVTFKVSW